MNVGKIDDPWEASRQAWKDEPELEAGETALSFAGLLNPAMAIFGVLRERFLSRNRAARLQFLLHGITLKFRELESRFAHDEGEIAAIREKINSTEFQAAATTAAEEAVRATDNEKIAQFSSVLGASLDPSIPHVLADTSGFIRDLAQLNAKDLQVLQLLKDVYGHLFPDYPNVHDPNPFTEIFQDFKDGVTRSRLHPDEFQAVCDRLRGFGLAAEVLRNVSRMAPGDFCYRPTHRGLRLLRLLGQS